MATLASYQTDVLRILHDQNLSTYTTVDVQSAVNEARRQTVADTGCLRSLQTLYIAPNVEYYAFGQINGWFITSGGSNYTNPSITISGGNNTTPATATATLTGGVITGLTITNPGAGFQPDQAAITYNITDATGSGAVLNFSCISVNTLDILQVNLVWTTTRVALDWRPWSEFSVQMRVWTNWQQRPAMWAQYGEQAIYIGPLPDQPYLCEVDTVLIPVDLVSTTTVDPISYIYQGPVKFYAAYLLKMKEQSFGEAEWFLKQYNDRVMQVQAQTAGRRVPSMYNVYGVDF